MNKELKDKIYTLPDNVIYFLKQQKDIEGLTRNKTLIDTGQVTYGQLKRILHDMKQINKSVDVNRYNLYGGDLMWNWGWGVLKTDRDLIKNRKHFEKASNEIGDIEGDRRNPSKTRKKRKDSFMPPVNFNKSNSEKFSFSSLVPTLNEEIERIKKLMK